MHHVEPNPIGPPFFFDLAAVCQSLDWLMTADDEERAQFLDGEAGAVWADRIRRVLGYVETQEAVRQAQSKPRTCPDCGHKFSQCICYEEDEEDEEPEERSRCGCPYCFCMNETDYGETCSMCLNHAHQG